MGIYETNSLYKCINTEDEEMNASIRRATSTGRPLGSEGFIKKLEKMLGRDIFSKKGGRPKRKDDLKGRIKI